MLAFAALALATLAAAFVWLWRPFWRRSVASRASAQQINTAIYRDQLLRLEQDVAEGHLSAQDRDAARDELQRRALDDVGAAAAATAPSVATPNKTLAAAALLCTAAAALLYLQLGSPALLVQGGAGPNASGAAPAGQALDLEKMVGQLAERMAQHPDDLKGWSMLGLSYKVMGRFPESEKAFERAGSFIDRDARMLASYADVAASNRGGDFRGKPNELIAKALQVEPGNGLALWLAGTAALQAGKPDAAIATWGRLMAQLQPGSEDARMLQSAIDEATRQKTAQSNGSPALVTKQIAATKNAANALPDDLASRATPAGGPAASVRGEVRIAAELQGRLPATATLLVIARRPGERMPLAVLRLPAAQLPHDFTLDDSLAMNPANRLSSAPEVEVLARLSQSGMAQAQAGDLTSEAQTVKPGATGIRLTLSGVQP